MAPRWIGLIIFVSIIAAIIGAAAQGGTLTTNVSANSTMDPNIDTVIHYQQAWQANPWGTLLNPIAGARFFTAIFSLLAGQQNLYSVFPEGTAWIWIWLIIWIPIMGTIVFGIIMLFIAIIQRVTG